MIQPSQNLDLIFGYAAPTEDTIVKHKALKAAHIAAVDALSTGQEPPTFDEVSEALKVYAAVIFEVCPDCADRTTAIRALRLVRGSINRAIVANNSDTPQNGQIYILASNLAFIEVDIWSNAAVALEGAV